MPVNVLYCEGGPKSPDVRVLSTLLAPICEIKPTGSKYGLGEKIRSDRNIRTSSNVAGLRDRDFDGDDSGPTGAPREWHVENGRVWLGLYWERLEIENYLIDPEIVQRSLGDRAPELGAYQAALQSAAESIMDYTAARTALTLFRHTRLLPLVNRWGPERGRDAHKFPSERTEVHCRNAIIDIVSQYTQTLTIQEQNVLNQFDTLLPACHHGGVRFQHFITFFSGKDLLFGMESALAGFGFASPVVFRERILKGIEESSEDVWTWLPEWQHLRDRISTINSNDGI